MLYLQTRQAASSMIQPLETKRRRRASILYKDPTNSAALPASVNVRRCYTETPSALLMMRMMMRMQLIVSISISL